MISRRKFMNTTIATGIGIAVANTSNLQAASDNYPKGIIYSADNPGMWNKKINSHAPIVKVKENKVTITTDHGMSEKHYIVRHTLVTPDGNVIGENTFSPDDENAVSDFELPIGHNKLIATSFCNKHDLWITEFSV
jgi:superoxide reductase